MHSKILVLLDSEGVPQDLKTFRVLWAQSPIPILLLLNPSWKWEVGDKSWEPNGFSKYVISKM